MNGMDNSNQNSVYPIPGMNNPLLYPQLANQFNVNQVLPQMNVNNLQLPGGMNQMQPNSATNFLHNPVFPQPGFPQQTWPGMNFVSMGSNNPPTTAEMMAGAFNQVNQRMPQQPDLNLMTPDLSRSSPMISPIQLPGGMRPQNPSMNAFGSLPNPGMSISESLPMDDLSMNNPQPLTDMIQELRMQLSKLQQENEQLKQQNNDLIAENTRLAQAQESQGHQV